MLAEDVLFVIIVNFKLHFLCMSVPCMVHKKDELFYQTIFYMLVEQSYHISGNEI